MSGHGLEEESREGNVTVLDEDGEVSEPERLRLEAILYCILNRTSAGLAGSLKNDMGKSSHFGLGS